MARQALKVEGLKELKAALDELPKATSTTVLKRALTKAGQPIASAAAAAAPDDPETAGYDLARSIIVGTRLSRRQKKKHRKESPVEVFVGAGPLSKATQQEFGNVRHGPQPFLRPAWDGGWRGALETIKTALASEIEKARKRLARKAARQISKMK